MPITHRSGDPLLTSAQTLAFAYNARAQSELGTLQTHLMNAHPPAFATYRKRAHAGKISGGDIWVWQQSRPMLCFVVVRDAPVGALRLRFLQSAMMHLARNYLLEGIRSIAIAPMGTATEWAESLPIIDTWLARSKLPVVVYDEVVQGVQADEGLG